METPELSDWPHPGYVDWLLAKLPAPRHPETGVQLWEKGIRLHGNQSAMMKSKARYKQGRGGIRAGKSYGAALAIFVDSLWRAQISKVTNDLWWVVGPKYELATEEMRHLHNLFDLAGIPHDFAQPSGASWSITFPHKDARIETRTGTDAAALAAVAPRGVVLAEANQQSWEVFINARLRTTQTRGWVWIEGTFENEMGGQWFRQISADWEKPGALGKSWPLPSWENLVVFPGGREDPEILLAEQTLVPAVFQEKYGGTAERRSDAAIEYADDRWQVRHRYPILGESFDPEQPVFLAIDPGAAHAYAVLAVQLWDQVTWVIDAVYRWGRTVEQIVEECIAKPWASKVGEAVMDFAGTQRRSEGPPNIEQWAKGWMYHTGNPIVIHADPVPLHAGYNIHKRALLNAWPEEEAQRMFNQDKRLRVVTDPSGPRLMFAPDAAAPLFGGSVDNQQYLGEYNLHRKKKNAAGTITSDEYVDTDNDAIKALNYFLHWRYGAYGDRHNFRFGSVPWRVAV